MHTSNSSTTATQTHQNAISTLLMQYNTTDFSAPAFASSPYSSSASTFRETPSSAFVQQNYPAYQGYQQQQQFPHAHPSAYSQTASLSIDPRALHAASLTRAPVSVAPQDDPEATPVVPWNDSPRTVYKSTPDTENGDADLEYDSDREDHHVKQAFARADKVSEFPPYIPLSPSASDLTQLLALLDANEQQFNSAFGDPLVVMPSESVPGSGASFEQFSKQLQQHIMLFQPNLPVIQSQATAEHVPTLVVQPPTPAVPQQQAAQSQHRIAQQQATLSVDQSAPSALSPDARPIVPLQMPPVRLINPPYRQPTIDPRALRQYRAPSPPQATVGPRDLIRPNAEFHFGYDPAEMWSLLTGHQLVNPVKSEVSQEAYQVLFPEHLEQSGELDDDDATAEGDYDEEFVVQEEPAEQAPAADDASLRGRQVHFDEPQTATSTKRPRSPSVHSTFGPDDESDLSDDDDGEVYRPSTHPSRPPKRQRLSPTTPINITTRHRHTRSVDSDLNSPSSASKRSRHLLRDIPRTHTCDYGCTSTFSTAYESRRHQEDVHVRNEATEILDSLRTPDALPELRPQDNKFLFKIALGGLAKWDDRTKESVRQYRDAVERTGRADSLPTALVQQVALAVKRFAENWVDRYICQGCGTKFSRMDSKKRHQKECKKSGTASSRSGRK